jgi:putative transcriptional regulator
MDAERCDRSPARDLLRSRSAQLALPEADGCVRNAVRELRTARELSQGELAEAVNVSRQTINSIEKGRYVPSLPLALTLARYFETSVEEMFDDEE